MSILLFGGKAPFAMTFLHDQGASQSAADTGEAYNACTATNKTAGWNWVLSGSALANSTGSNAAAGGWTLNNAASKQWSLCARASLYSTGNSYWIRHYLCAADYTVAAPYTGFCLQIRGSNLTYYTITLYEVDGSGNLIGVCSANQGTSTGTGVGGDVIQAVATCDGSVAKLYTRINTNNLVYKAEGSVSGSYNGVKPAIHTLANATNNQRQHGMALFNSSDYNKVYEKVNTWPPSL